MGSSETIRGEIVNNVKAAPTHVPVHLRPGDDIAFGHYLAGLIDGDGHFSVQQQLVIAFSGFDSPLAHYIKFRLGFGRIYEVKNKNALILVVSAYAGMEKVIRLINGKLRTAHRYNQVVNNILHHPRYAAVKRELIFTMNLDQSLENY